MPVSEIIAVAKRLVNRERVKVVVTPWEWNEIMWWAENLSKNNF